MNSRREFIATLGTALAATGTAYAAAPAVSATVTASGRSPEERAAWQAMLLRVVEPVLTNLAVNRLKQEMPVESPASPPKSRQPATYLEALGRTLAGIAPWLELEGKSGPEAESAARLSGLARQAIANITDPQAADHVSFTSSSQCLVDAAFLSQAVLRSRRELWEKLDPATQKRLVAELQSTRRIKPGDNNWLLFSAMVEVMLACVGASWLPEPVERAVVAHEKWYKGDGAYGDGAEFHWDYYNSFVIQPMLLDVLENMDSVDGRWAARLPKVRERAKRYAVVQERMIAPDGSYPVLGRSIAYRCGAFHLLARMALHGQLPDHLAAAQVRGALSAVIQRTLGAAGTFDANGWLRVGLCGHQPGLAENYISTGSLYLCTFVFLPLGLPPAHPFWSDPAEDWTSRKAWSGSDMAADHAFTQRK